MPKCMAMGIGYDEFWHLNPRKLNIYIEAYKLTTLEKDRFLWLMGEYAFEAVSVAIGNAFSKHSAKKSGFSDVREKPILEEKRWAEGDITDSERVSEVEKLFASLDQAKAIFDAQKH